VEACRPATPGDLPQVARLARRLRADVESVKGGSIWIVREALREPLEQTYAAFLDRSDATLVVGTLDDVIVGAGALEMETLTDDTRLGVIRELFVEPDARAVGVGETILDVLSTFCRDAGGSGIDALALPGDRATKNFFEQQGLTARALVMHRPLASEDP
jgi:N-acetylglutamate synthase-like GNAT family acetyltransferase